MKLIRALMACACISIIFGYTTLCAQDRNVVWLHDLKQSNAAWNSYAQYFEGSINNFSSVNLTYSTEDGIEDSSEDALSKIDNVLGSSNENADNIYIGYGLGGIVSAYINKNYSNNPRFGGVVLTSSPNRGIALVDAYNQGKLASFSSRASEALPFSTYNYKGLNIGQIPLNYAIDNFESITSDELVPTSSLLGDLEGAFDDVVLLTFYSNERTPSHWKFFESIVDDPSSLTLNVTSDNEIQSIVNNARDDYQYFQNLNNFTGIFLAVVTVVSVLEQNYVAAAIWGGGSVLAFSDAQEAKRQKIWIDDSQLHWNELIDANSTYEINLNYTSFDHACDDFYMIGTQQWIDCISYWCGGVYSNCWTVVNTTVTGFSSGDNDGLLSKGTMMPFISAQNSIIRIDEVNHLEVVNHPNSSLAFAALWAGQYGPFFIIE